MVLMVIVANIIVGDGWRYDSENDEQFSSMVVVMMVIIVDEMKVTRKKGYFSGDSCDENDEDLSNESVEKGGIS